MMDQTVDFGNVAIVPTTVLPSLTKTYDGTATSANLTTSASGVSLTGTDTLSGKNAGTETLTSTTPGLFSGPYQGYNGGNSSSYTISISAPTKGNTLVAMVGAYGLNNTLSVTSSGLSWSQAVYHNSGDSANTYPSGAIFYAPVTSTGVGTTVTISGASTSWELLCDGCRIFGNMAELSGGRRRSTVEAVVVVRSC